MAAGKDETTNPFGDDLDDFEYDTALSRLEQTQNRILGSTSRSLGLIEESHDIAIKTAEELQRQEETLYRTERNLDDMSRNMTTANRHIKSVKSVWGAIGNYFTKPKDDPKLERQPVKAEVPERNLNIDSELRLDYGEQDYLGEYGGSGRGTASFERQYDNHLGEISRGLSILKDDALVLGQTIDRHDDIITRVQGKVEKVDEDIGIADRKIRKILRN
jgi:synaptosomal-associated protein 29